MGDLSEEEKRELADFDFDALEGGGEFNLDTLPPKFDNKPIQWFKGDEYLANSIECYADAR